MREHNDLLRHAEALTPTKATRAALVLVVLALGVMLAVSLF